jgi:hypothetical protein
VRYGPLSPFPGRTSSHPPALPAGRSPAKIAEMSVTPPPLLDRRQAAAAVLAAKKRTGVRWADLGKAIGMSTEWTTAALPSQAVKTGSGYGI